MTPLVRRLMKTEKDRNLKIFEKTSCSRCKWRDVHEGSCPGLLTGFSRPLLWSAVREGARVQAKPPGRGRAEPPPVSFLLSPCITSSLTLV